MPKIRHYRRLVYCYFYLYLNEEEIALLLKTIDEHPKLQKRDLIVKMGV